MRLHCAVPDNKFAIIKFQLQQNVKYTFKLIALSIFQRSVKLKKASYLTAF